MSLINEIVSRVDVNIDRLYSHTPEPFGIESTGARGLNARDSRQLQSAVRALSVENHGLLSRRNLLRVLGQSQTNKLFAFPTTGEGVDHHEASDEQSWFLAAKFTAQTLGTVLQILLEQSSLLGAEIEYWDDVLGSRFYTANYAVQMAPWTAWEWMTEVLSNVRTASVRENFTSMTTINRDWKRFYQLVQNNIRRGLTHNTTNTLSSPFTRYRLHLRRRRQTLDELKDLIATAVGILLEECLTFATLDGSSDTNPAKSNRERGYALYRTALLIEKTIDNLSQPLDSSKNVEEQIFLVTDNAFRDKQGSSDEAHPVAPTDVVERLVHVLKYCVPEYLTYNQRFIRTHGRPSVFARYWFPTTATLFSLSTSLRFITNHQAELLQWLSELGQTSVDFWQNWVLQPIQNIIGTIRHDEQSEIAIMSRSSLEADRQSLERMVVDFVSDNASHRASGNPESDTATLIAQVREGDLTPVLKAYERDLRKPFLGTVRGDLVRAVLIQIQKTKVDIEVAMGGIDSLLKSQELVFGFIGLTPGLLITYSAMRWIAGLFDSRKGFRAGLQRQGFRGSVRNLDRILGVYTTQPDSVLSYRDYGLCIYEAQILKQRAQYTLPRSFMPSFQQDLMDLTDLSHGVRRQRNALQRIEWTYSKWL